jgi:endonuclease/exonuclease/phosphatase family metal-dependent hydrolase
VNVWRPFGLIVVALTACACATAHNYLDPAAPLYEGSFGAPPAARADLRVVSFNVEYALRVPGAIEALRTQPDLRGADVLLLQEMDAPGAESVARALSMNYVYCPSSVSPKYHRDVGTAVLSPWPIESRWKVRLPHFSRGTRHARSVVGVTVRVGERRLRVYSIHLGTPINLSPRKRREQLDAVLEDARDSETPVIVGGDFNGKSMAERLADRGFDWPTRHVGRTTAFFSFDHILTRGLPTDDGAQAGVAREVKGVSDHRPIWALFRD